MFIKNTISKNTSAYKQNDAEFVTIEQKLNEFIQLLKQSAADSAKLKGYEEKLTAAFAQTRAEREKITAFEVLDNQPELSRMDLLNNLDLLLSKHELNSNMTRQSLKKGIPKRVLLILTGIVIITLGFSMIILPAPPSFEIFTVFNFNDNDGITVMDLISLLIILTGIYLIVINANKKTIS